MKWYKKFLLAIGFGTPPKQAAIKLVGEKIDANVVSAKMMDANKAFKEAVAPELHLPTTYKCLKPLRFVKEIVAECEFAHSEGYSRLRLMATEPIKISSSTKRALIRRGYRVDTVTPFNVFIIFPRAK